MVARTLQLLLRLLVELLGLDYVWHSEELDLVFANDVQYVGKAQTV